MGWSSGATGGGGGIDPTRFVPKTRTINGKALDEDVILKLVDISNESGVSLDVLINNLNTSTEGLGDLSKQVESNALSIKKIKQQAMTHLNAMPEVSTVPSGLSFAFKISFEPQSLKNVRSVYFNVPVVMNGRQDDYVIRIDVVSGGASLEMEYTRLHYNRTVAFRHPITMSDTTTRLIIPFSIKDSQSGDVLKPSDVKPMSMWKVAM